MVESLRVDSPGHLLDLAEFFAVGACNAETILLRFPYEPEEMPTKMFRQLSDRRHIGAHLEPLPTLVKVIDTLLEARADTASLLWGTEIKAARAGADEALTRADGQLVNRFHELPRPVSPVAALHHVLTGVRYARLDAHVFAWRRAGLDPAGIVALSAAVESGEEQGHHPELVDRGWFTSDGTVTSEGRRARQRIENQTNDRCAAMFAAVNEPSQWLESLRRLPSQLDQN